MSRYTEKSDVCFFSKSPQKKYKETSVWPRVVGLIQRLGSSARAALGPKAGAALGRGGMGSLLVLYEERVDLAML